MCLFAELATQNGIVVACLRKKALKLAFFLHAIPCSEGLFVSVLTSVCPPKGLVRLTELQKVLHSPHFGSALGVRACVLARMCVRVTATSLKR